jgi:putative ABC transport system ATP-binding protein
VSATPEPQVRAGLRVCGLRVQYGALVAVRDVDVHLEPGLVVAVVGPSGAGKSSLVWALAGALEPAAGTVTVGGVPVTGRQQAAALGVAVVPQGNGLASSLTAHENVLVPLLAAGVPVLEARERAERALDEVGVAESADHLVEELSGGQQQRVAVARALAAHATVLLADEPTSDLDAGNRERMMAALRGQADRGAAVLVTTHDPEAAEQADGELAMDEGRLSWRRHPTLPPGPHPSAAPTAPSS